MQDIVGERLIKQTRQRRKERWQYAALYSFLAVNVIYWIAHFI